MVCVMAIGESEALGKKRAETKEVLFDLIVKAAGHVNTSNGESVRALAEAYALLVRPDRAGS